MKKGYALIGNLDHPDRNSTDNEYFSLVVTCLTKFYQHTRIIILHWRPFPRMCYCHQSMELVHIQTPSQGRGLEWFHLAIYSRGNEIKQSMTIQKNY